MNESITCLEDCLIALGSKKPFLKETQIGLDGSIKPFTKSGNIAYEKLRNILIFLKEQKIVDKFDEDLLDEIANGFGCF